MYTFNKRKDQCNEKLLWVHVYATESGEECEVMRVCAYVRVCAWVCVDVWMDVCACVSIHVCLHTMRVCMRKEQILSCVFVHVCVQVCVHVCAHACIHAFQKRRFCRVYACMCVYMYACMYAYLYACMPACM